MAVTIRIMNWNVQNFGPAKSGLKSRRFDVVEAIAKVVVALNVDIFVMLEVNTTGDSTAYGITTLMLQYLQHSAAQAGNAGWYKEGVLSPNTGLEYYAYFVRDSAVTRPLPISGYFNSADVPEELGAAPHRLAQAEFGPTNGVGMHHDLWFPLWGPDVAIRRQGRAFNITWPAVRLPVFGLFHVPGASATNRLLPIVACHFAAQGYDAAQQLQALEAFSLFEELADPAPANSMLRVEIAPGAGQQALPVTHYVLLGDFNIDYNDSTDSYKKLRDPFPDGEGMTGWIQDKTHLVTLANYDSRTMKLTKDLAINAYDNFFTGVNAASIPAVTAASPLVKDIAEDVRTRELMLDKSVKHYADLDQRGFQDDKKYESIMLDYARQLRPKYKSYHTINTPGALAGARLISDHLPVLLDVTLN